MSQLRTILKAANITPAQLSEAMGMPLRTISYQFSTGRIPYALVYKLHLVTGVSIDELIPKYLAENWLFLFEEQNKANKPRGKQRSWKPGDNEKQQKVKPIAEKIATTHTVVAEEKKVVISIPRETPPPIPKSVTPDIPESVTPAPKKKSIADLMKSEPPPAPVEQGAPDFSGIDDSVFQTSMDVANNAIRKRR